MVGGGGVMVRFRVWVVLVLVLGLLGSGLVGADGGGVVLQEGGDGGGGVPLGSGLFDDVPEGHWADEEVGWAVSNGVMEGVGGGRFDLVGVVPRWQIVSVLFRAFVLAGGEPVGGGLGSDVFVDVPVGHVADVEIGWAVASGITRGVGGGRFDPDGSVTRAQIVTFLFRLSGLLGGPVGGGGLGSDVFVDVPVGHWADEEVGWAVVGGVTVGVGGGRFDLGRVVSRAQIVTFLFRVVGLVEESRVVVRVGEVDLAHIDAGEVRVGLGGEGPVGAGEELVGRVNTTGVAVAQDGDGVAQGLSLVLQGDEPVEVRITYLTTAVALVFLSPGIATTDTFLSLATVLVLSQLPELQVFADQLEADAARFGRSYLVDLSPEAAGALAAAVDAFFRVVPPRGGGPQASSGFSGSSFSDAAGVVLGAPPVLGQNLVCRGEETESVWDPVGGSFGVWDPTDSGRVQNDGVCVRGSEGDVVGKNHGWAAVAVLVDGDGDGEQVRFVEGPYIYMSTLFYDIPTLTGAARAVVEAVGCSPIGFPTGIFVLAAMAIGLIDLEDYVEDCLDAWDKALAEFDFAKGDTVDFSLDLLGESSPRYVAVVRSPVSGPNPFQASNIDVPVELQNRAYVYQLTHLLTPTFSVMVNGAVGELSVHVANTMVNTQGLGNYHSNYKAGAVSAAIQIGQLLATYVDANLLEATEKAAAHADATLLEDYSNKTPLTVDTVSSGELLYEAAWIISTEAIYAAFPALVRFDSSIDIANIVFSTLYSHHAKGYESLSFYADGPKPPPILPERQECDINVTIADMTLGDLYNAGREDIIVAGAQGIKAYRSDGQGGYGEGAIISCDITNINSLAVGDITGDGHTDIVVTQTIGQAGFNTATPRRVVLLQGEAVSIGGHTETIAFPTSTVLKTIHTNSPISLAIGDLPGSNHPDLVIGTGGRIERYNHPANTWTAITTSLGDSLTNIAIGDINGDQHNDLAAITPTQLWAILYNPTNNTYQTPTPLGHTPNTTENLQIAVADLNTDQAADIITADQNRTTIHISNPAFFQNPTSTYQPPPLHLTTPGNPHDIAIGTIAGDPNPDIITIRRDPDKLQILQSHSQNNQQGLCATSTPLLNGTAIAIPMHTTNTIIATNTTTHQTPNTATTCQTHHPLPIIETLEPTENRDEVFYNSITAGGHHSCALRQDSTITCWGNNYVGQTEAPGGTFTTITAGKWHSCGVRTDQTVTCWGKNHTGQAEAPGGTFTTITAGHGGQSCGVRTDQTVTCWGNNSSGQAEAPGGNFSTVSASNFSSCAIRTNGRVACWGAEWSGETNSPGGTFTTIAAGLNYWCAIRTDRTIECWGDNSSGQTEAPGGTFTAITAGFGHSCAIRSDGTVVCWGDNSSGQTEAPAGSFTTISAGDRHSCAIRSDGTVVCWGDNSSGQTEAPAGSFTTISAGDLHSCAIRSDGTVVCWGEHSSGQTEAPAGSFTTITTNKDSISGNEHWCAIRADGTIACWGDNWSGETEAPKGTFTAIAISFSHSCAIRSDGTVACWGDIWPSDVVPKGTFTAITVGLGHSCAIRADGTIACWGDNWSGQTEAPPGIFTAITAGLGHSCAIRADGTIACWGSNWLGQTEAPPGIFTSITIGNQSSCGIRTNASVACWGEDGRIVAPKGTFTTISAGFSYWCGIRTDSTIDCWHRWFEDTPDGSFTVIAPGWDHMCGIRTDSTIDCWGRNWAGQTEAPEGTFTSMAVNDYQSCGIENGGTIICWGPRLFTLPPIGIQWHR